jgi:hypothetical protein
VIIFETIQMMLGAAVLLLGFARRLKLPYPVLLARPVLALRSRRWMWGCTSIRMSHWHCSPRQYSLMRPVTRHCATLAPLGAIASLMLIAVGLTAAAGAWQCPRESSRRSTALQTTPLRCDLAYPARLCRTPRLRRRSSTTESCNRAQFGSLMSCKGSASANASSSFASTS